MFATGRAGVCAHVRAHAVVSVSKTIGELEGAVMNLPRAD